MIHTENDYQSGVYNVTLAAEMNSVIVNIPIKEDMILEGKEQFMLTILSVSPQGGVIIGSPVEATVTIMDNDGKHFTDCSTC